MVSMKQLNTTRRAQIVASLVEGNSIRSTVCMTGASATPRRRTFPWGSRTSLVMVMLDLDCTGR